MRAFILAGGRGVRLRPATDRIPKVMLPIGGKPVLEHLVRLCVHHGIREIIFGLYYLPETVERYFGEGERFGAKISYSVEPRMMGGAGAMKHAARFLCHDDFLVMSGDVMTNVDLEAMNSLHREKGGLGTFLVHPTDHPFDSDIVEFGDDLRITKFFRPREGDVFRAISKTGTHLFRPEILDRIPDGEEYSLERQLIPNALADQKSFYAYHSGCYSKDMGTPERLARVEKDYLDGKISF